MEKNKKSIFVTQPSMPPLNEFVNLLDDIWESKWITNNGKYHQLLEEALAQYLNVKYISLFTNGTLALITALQTLRITGEVITTPYSFVATTHALHWNGIKPVFVDIEPVTLNLDPDKIESAITPKTTAILPVHVYGNPCSVNHIQKIADTYGLKIIYDACHTFGLTLNKKPILDFGDLSVLSFHATKVYNTIEGGAIVCHDEKTKKRIDYFKNFGFADEITVVSQGINAKMNELQAAYGILQLKYIDDNIEKRREISSYYRSKFENVIGIRLIPEQKNVKLCYAYFPIFIDSLKFGKTRDEVYGDLKKNNIFGRRYFYPLITHFPTYRGLSSASAENLPVAEKATREVLCLPIYPELTSENINHIVGIVLRK